MPIPCPTSRHFSDEKATWFGRLRIQRLVQVAWQEKANGCRFTVRSHVVRCWRGATLDGMRGHAALTQHTATLSGRTDDEAHTSSTSYSVHLAQYSRPRN